MKSVLSLFLLIIGMQLSAQTVVTSKIDQVKVFMRNAEISRKGHTNLRSGVQDIVLTGISTAIDPSSLQIQFKNSSGELLAAKYEPNHLLAQSNNPKIANLKVKYESIADDLSWIIDQKNALLGMEEVLKKNQDLGGQSGFTPAQVMELTNKYRIKYLEIRKELKGILKKEKTLKQSLANANRQLQEMNAKFNKPSGTIVLKVSSKTNAKLTIECKYIVRNAGWSPLYDLRSSGITQKVKLNYRANIVQNTGQDWNNAKLIVSTGNPTQNNERPILSPLYVNIAKPYDYKIEKQKSVSTLNMAYALDERKKGDKNDPFKANAKINENQMAIEFQIQNKQSIISDGKENLVALKNYDLPTEYIYHTVPKLSNGAYLLAKISDWSHYNLLPGKANIFFEGAFVGNSNINPQITADTMLISLGRDNGIIVQRKPIEKYTDKKAVGTNKKETMGYEIIVKNTKSVPIKIEVLDQIPVSQNSKINVDLKEKGNADYLKKIGKLLWTTTIAPRASWKDQFVYSVRYPKNDAVAGIK